jgi:hypothetical protein
MTDDGVEGNVSPPQPKAMEGKYTDDSTWERMRINLEQKN